jgi:hypothetical protein
MTDCTPSQDKGGPWATRLQTQMVLACARPVR